MKLIVLISFFFVFSVANAQDYQPLLAENKSWSTVDEYFHLAFGDANRSHHYYLDGDSLINSNLFFKIYKIDDYYSTDEMFGFIREDTLKRVYFRDLQENDGLIYDFAVNINDTIEYTYMGIHSILAVVKGISEFDGTNPPRRSIELHEIEGLTTETWIEGIGSSQGLLESGAEISGIVGGDFELLCYHENDSVIYLNPRFSGCSWPSNVGTNQLEGKERRVLISPNPVVNFSSFEIEDQSDLFIIEFYNASGQLIFKKQISNSNKFIINKSDLCGGIVLYRVVYNNQKLTGTFQVLE